MIEISSSSKQPLREAWSMDRLVNERSISLGYSIDSSTFDSYTSALNSYLTFCNLHQLPIEPTPDTLSFYIVFLSSHINPRSVSSYLSGICRQLEPFFPDIRLNRKSILVTRTMSGCMCRFGTPIKHKAPLSRSDLKSMVDQIGLSASHDDLLFISQLLTGFHGLLRLGELVFLDKLALRNYRKISLRHSVRHTIDHYSFFLPSHKADRTFEGNTVLIQKLDTPTDPYKPFLAYLASRDNLFPLNPELWLTSRGSVPTRHWFMCRLRTSLSAHFGGHSMRAGGATSLAEAGADVSTIQAIGRWSSDAFQIYIRKHPVVLHAILFGRPAHQPAV